MHGETAFAVVNVQYPGDDEENARFSRVPGCGVSGGEMQGVQGVVVYGRGIVIGIAIGGGDDGGRNRARVNDGKQFVDVDVLGGESGAQHVVRSRHEFDILAVQVGMGQTRGLIDAFAGLQVHDIEEIEGEQAGIEGIAGDVHGGAGVVQPVIGVGGTLRRRGLVKQRMQPCGKIFLRGAQNPGIGFMQAVARNQFGNGRQAGAGAQAFCHHLQRRKAMQQPEFRECNHAFRLVVVIAIVALRGGDVLRSFARITRFGLGFIGMELDGERQAHVKDFQQIGQMIAKARARLRGKGVRMLAQPLVKGGVVVNARRRLGMIAKPEFGFGRAVRRLPQQLCNVIRTAPGVGLDGAVQGINHGCFP